MFLLSAVEVSPGPVSAYRVCVFVCVTITSPDRFVIVCLSVRWTQAELDAGTQTTTSGQICAESAFWGFGFGLFVAGQ